MILQPASSSYLTLQACICIYHHMCIRSIYPPIYTKTYLSPCFYQRYLVLIATTCSPVHEMYGYFVDVPGSQRWLLHLLAVNSVASTLLITPVAITAGLDFRISSSNTGMRGAGGGRQPAAAKPPSTAMIPWVSALPFGAGSRFSCDEKSRCHDLVLKRILRTIVSIDSTPGYFVVVIYVPVWKNKHWSEDASVVIQNETIPYPQPN